MYLESSRDLTILIMPSILLFDIVSVAYEGLLPDPMIFLCIPASASDAIAANLKGIKKLLANVLMTFF